MLTCLKREVSAAFRVICSKDRGLRTCRVHKACRVTMLEKIVLSILLQEIEKKGITDTITIRNMLNKLVPVLLKDERLKQFIVMNDLKAFRGEELTSDHLHSLSKPGVSVYQVVIPIVIVRKINGIIGHYLLLIYENGKWYYYGSYGSDLVSISPAKIEINIDEFIKFVNILNQDIMDDADVAFVEMYVKKIFLPEDHATVPMGTDESGSSTRAFFMDIQKGRTKEARLYIEDTHFGVLYIPELYRHVEQLLRDERIQSIIRSYARLSTVPENGSSTFSAASASAASAAHDHTTRTSGP